MHVRREKADYQILKEIQPIRRKIRLEDRLPVRAPEQKAKERTVLLLNKVLQVHLQERPVQVNQAVDKVQQVLQVHLQERPVQVNQAVEKELLALLVDLQEKPVQVNQAADKA